MELLERYLQAVRGYLLVRRRDDIIKSAIVTQEQNGIL